MINKVGRRRRGAANTHTLWFDIEIKLQKFFYRLRSSYSRTPRKRPPKLTLLDSDCLYDLNRKRSISGNRSVQEPGLYYLEKHQFIRVQFWRSSFIRAVLFSVSRKFFSNFESRSTYSKHSVQIESRGDQWSLSPTKRDFKSEFALPQTWSRLFHLVWFVKC